MTSNSVNHSRIKHIDVAYHYVRDKVKEGTLKLKYIFINQMVADGLIKPLKVIKFLASRSMMGLSAVGHKEEDPKPE